MLKTIADLLELEAYVEELKTRIPGLNDYVYLGQGEEFDAAIQSYFNNKYKGGTTLFLGIFESFTKSNGGNQSFAPVFCQVCVLTKADPKVPKQTLVARNETWKTTLRIIGLMEKDMEDSRLSSSQFRLRIEVDQDKLIPLERVANVNAWGWGAEVVFSIPVNSLKYQ